MNISIKSTRFYTNTAISAYYSLRTSLSSAWNVWNAQCLGNLPPAHLIEPHSSYFFVNFQCNNHLCTPPITVCSYYNKLYLATQSFVSVFLGERRIDFWISSRQSGGHTCTAYILCSFLARVLKYAPCFHPFAVA